MLYTVDEKVLVGNNEHQAYVARPVRARDDTVLVRWESTGAREEVAVGDVKKIDLDAKRQTRGKRVLLFLNKRDASSALPEETVKLLFDLDALEAALAGRLSVVAGSALTGDGLTAVLDFCADCVVEMEEAEKEAKLAEEAAKVRAANREKEEAQTKRDMAAAEKAKAADEAAAAAAAGAIAAPSAAAPRPTRRRARRR